MQISSSAFSAGEFIPKNFCCDGKGISPPLSFSYIPDKAQSLVLIMDDPDAPSGLYTHWLIWNIPPTISEIPEGGFIEGAVEGVNSSGGQGYVPPCPPNGTHRYFFKLYALDIVVSLAADAGRNDLEEEMQDHILSQTELVGLYER
jgi:Raf kinase inhibitor-like YbhB/YbcL family protein